LRGITAQPDPILFPMILGNDGAGTLDDGTPVVIYPVCIILHLPNACQY
jgi:hypothetical protein